MILNFNASSSSSQERHKIHVFVRVHFTSSGATFINDSCILITLKLNFYHCLNLELVLSPSLLKTFVFTSNEVLAFPVFRENFQFSNLMFLVKRLPSEKESLLKAYWAWG